MENRQKIVVIVGPTASGKTALGIQLAQRFNGEIISADSRQVYRGFDIGTGKVTPEEMGGVPHHLLDITDPGEVYTVSDFVRDGRTAIADILARGKLPILVGGTFLYVDALLGKISTPDVPPNHDLRKKLETVPGEELYNMLQVKDPRRAADIDPSNKRRIIRALEIIEALGHVPTGKVQEVYESLVLGISLPQSTLHENIHRRLHDRIEGGMIEEVESLYKNGLSYERLNDLGLEYRYIARYLKGELTQEQMQSELETKIRQFAKRQMTWLKRDPAIFWVNPEDTAVIENHIHTFLSL